MVYLHLLVSLTACCASFPGTKASSQASMVKIAVDQLMSFLSCSAMSYHVFLFLAETRQTSARKFFTFLLL